MTTKIPVELSSTPSIVDNGDATAITIDSSERVGIGTSSPSAPLTISTTGSGDAVIIESTDAGSSNAPDLVLHRNSASPADNDSLGIIRLRGENDASEAIDLINIFGQVTDVSDGSEDSTLYFKTYKDGAEQSPLTLAGGNIGIGTTVPAGTLHTYTTSGNVATIMQTTVNGAASSSNYITPNRTFYTGVDIGGVNSSWTIYDGSAGSERMRISSSGNLAVGTTTATHKLEVLSTLANYASGRVTNNTGSGSTEYGFISQLNGDPNNTTNYLYLGGSPSTTRFVVYSNGNVANTNNSYGAYSDVKLKENIVDANPQLEKIKQLQVRNFNLKAEPDKKLIGLVAQEAETIFPKLIDETEDTKNDENGAIVKTGETTKSIKYSVFVPVLIKAIQEQQEQIEALQAEINTLKGE